MPKKTERDLLKKQIGDLERQLEIMNKEAKHWKDQWAEKAHELSQLLPAKMEIDRLERRQKLVGLIAAGKNLEAIDFLLTTQVMLFKVDVRFADDKTRMAAEDEQLEKVKALVADTLSNVKFNREKEGTEYAEMAYAK